MLVSRIVEDAGTQPTGECARLKAVQRIIPHLPIQAVLIMMIAIGFYAFQDAFIKSLPSSVQIVEILFFRSVFALPVLFFLVRGEKHKNPWKTKHPFQHLVRAGLSLLATFFFVRSFRQMPLADAYALTFCGPVFMAILGTFWLKEGSSLTRWGALFVGFLGVWLICAPSFATPLLCLIPLSGGLFHALAQMSLQTLTREDSTTLIVAVLLGISMLICGPAVLLGSHSYDMQILLLFGAVGVFGGIAQWCMTHAFRRADLTFLAPFDYAALLWGVGFDHFLWHKEPSLALLVGAGLILGAGGILLHQEQKKMKAQTS